MREHLAAQIPALRRYARMLTGDVWAADDLIQDTLERACTKWSLWIAGSDLRAWLFTLMHNQHISHMRRRTHQPPPGAMLDAAELESELVALTADPSARMDLQACLLRLPEDQRRVLLLVTVEDFSYAEVAAQLKVPVGTVMSRLHRARTRLWELMEAPAQKVTSPQEPLNKAQAPHLKRLK